MLPSAETISQEQKIPLDLVEKLLRGITKDDLEDYLAKLYQITNEVQLEIGRMNTIGGLRSWGYVIPRITGFYQITDFQAKKDTQTIEQYGGDAWDWVQSLEKVTKNDRLWVEESLLKGRNTAGTHESSWGYIWCYELARDQGYKFETKDGHRAIIMQKHLSAPRFRIFNFSLTPEELCLYGEELAKISRQAVRCLFLSDTDLAALRKLDKGGWKANRQQAVCKINRLAGDAISHLTTVNKRAWEGLRKAKREVQWDRLDVTGTTGQDREGQRIDREDIRKVIETWKSHNQAKHRQLAITRDFQCVDSLDLDNFAFMGYREDNPCCVHLLDRMIHVPALAQIVEKSLNYSELPGGKYGTADFNLWNTCTYLAEHHPEIEFLNLGGYDGGGFGLPKHKALYCLPENDVYSVTFDLSFNYLQRSQIEIE